jgi:methionyl-tRNA formyltransferase
MNEVIAMILCNNPIALPGIKEFLFYGKVAVVVTTNRNKEMQHILSNLLKDTGVPLLLVNRKNYKDELEKTIKERGVNVGLMMTFPFIIQKELLELPKYGFINFHYGLLPVCRGPQPVLRHLINNDAESGVTLHKIDEGVDTGPVIMQERMLIEENDTYGTLQSKLAWLGAKQAARLLQILSYGQIIPASSQDESKAAYFEMPDATELTIKWDNMPAKQIIRLVNACNPWNKGAGTSINNWVIGIIECEISGETDDDLPPGTILSCNRIDGLVVKTCDKFRLKMNIIYTNEGFFSGWRLEQFGINPKDTFK